MIWVRSHGDEETPKRDPKALEKQTEPLLERIVDASSSKVVVAYEKKIEQPEEQKLLLAEKLENVAHLRDGSMMCSNTLGDFSQVLGRYRLLAISHSSEQC